jgi:hypothetical protein
MSPNETISTTNASPTQTYAVDKARKANFDYLRKVFSPYENDKLKLIPDKLDSVLNVTNWC